MTISRIALLGIALVTSASIGAPPEKPVTSKQLIDEYTEVWDEFVSKFQTASQARARLALVESYSEKANAVFADHLTGDQIADVLPKLENAKLLKLEPTFLPIVGKHPDHKVRAQALLSLGHYMGHNQRFEECDVTLTYLKRSFGKLPFGRDGTFGDAADHFRYFYKNVAVGRPAPPTAGEDVDGGLFRLADYEGKVVMLRFWGDWCPPCRAMYDYERDIVKKYEGRPFALVGCNSDPKARCRKAQIDSRLVWRSFWDGGNTTGPISRLYQVTQWPTIVVIDSRGIIRLRTKGLNREYLTGVLDRLIEETEARGT